MEQFQLCIFTQLISSLVRKRPKALCLCSPTIRAITLSSVFSGTMVISWKRLNKNLWTPWYSHQLLFKCLKTMKKAGKTSNDSVLKKVPVALCLVETMHVHFSIEPHMLYFNGPWWILVQLRSQLKFSEWKKRGCCEYL